MDCFTTKKYKEYEECDWDLEVAVVKIVKLKNIINRLSRKIQKRNSEIRLFELSLKNSEEEKRRIKRLSDPDSYRTDLRGSLLWVTILVVKIGNL